MVGECLDDFSKRLGQEDKAQENSGVEIFAYKAGATQIKSILAPCRMSCLHLRAPDGVSILSPFPKTSSSVDFVMLT